MDILEELKNKEGMQAMTTEEQGKLTCKIREMRQSMWDSLSEDDKTYHRMIMSGAEVKESKEQNDD